MNYKDIELTTGKTVRVYIPPTFRIRGMLTKKYKVEVPIVTEKTGSGKEISMAISDDPQYLLDLAESEERIDREAGELDMLFALKDEEVPDGFDISTYEDLLLLADPDWSPREGKAGHKLDWIEWDLLSSPVDMSRVQVALTDLISVDMEVVEAVKESFSD